ncbi:MAG: ATP-binding cassette domain-containing protein [Lactobacillaceae bacterium]|jgi:ABC-2 type transport system ATP-binding protein|nr:ATP-binding cassette domain-containing protein [Lactobacillaceae bacterium]
MVENEKVLIKLTNVSKRFGHKQTLTNLNVEIHANRVYGFSGPNGSGKTLTFKTILGFIRATEGWVLVQGQELRKDTLFASNIGFAIQEYGMLPNQTGQKNLKLLALIGKTETDQEAELLRRVGLDPNDERNVKDYSLGMKQRLLIAGALVNDPPIVIFDEPTNALDEAGQQFLITLIAELKAAGKTILVSSHDAAFLRQVADQIFFYNEGSIVREESL